MAATVSLNLRSSLTRTLPPAAAAAGFSIHPSLRTAVDRFNNDDDKATMIVRIRSNLGLWRVTLADDGTTVSAIERELQRIHGDVLERHRFSKPFSLDAAGTCPLDTLASLKEQGIEHGAMIYCRLEEKESDLKSPSVPQDSSLKAGGKEKALVDSIQPKLINIPKMAAPPNHRSPCIKNPIHKSSKRIIQKKPNNNNDNVVDLMASSDEENDDNDDDGSVQLISPPCRKPTQEEQMTSSVAVLKCNKGNDPPIRKRRRSPTMEESSRARTCSTSTSRTLTSKDDATAFQIASYNVWFGPPDPEGDQVYPKERMTAIVECVQMACMARSDNPLLFLGLQELTPSLVGYLKPLLSQLGYKLCTQPLGVNAYSYGVGMAVPQDMDIVKHRFVPYSNTRQGRGLLYVKTPKLLLATTHLESWTGPQSDGSTEREVQILEAARFCKTELEQSPSMKLAAIIGDLNWDDERKRNPSEAPNRNLLSLLPNGWKDAGKPFDYTYDATENPMLGGNLRRRFDRCIYYSKDEDELDCLELQKVGQEAIPGLVWQRKNPYTGNTKPAKVAPSDHFGLVLSFGKS